MPTVRILKAPNRVNDPSGMSKVKVDGKDYFIDEDGFIFSKDGKGNLIDEGDGSAYPASLKKKILNNAPDGIKNDIMGLLNKTSSLTDEVVVTDKRPVKGNVLGTDKMFDKSILGKKEPSFNPKFSFADRYPTGPGNTKLTSKPGPLVPASEKDYATEAKPMIDNFYANLLDNLSKFDSENAKNYQDQLNTIEGLTEGKYLRSGIGFANNLIGNSLQDPTEAPALRDNTFLKGKYQGTPDSVVEQQAQALRGAGSGIASELMRAGADPSDIVSMLSGMQQNEVNAESQLRSGFERENRNLRRGYFSELGANADANNAEMARVARVETDNLNKKRQFLTNDVNQYLTNIDKIEGTNYDLTQNALKDFNKNKGNIFQNRLNVGALEMGTNLDWLRLAVQEAAAKNILNMSPK